MTNKLRWSLALLALGLMAAGLYAQTGPVISGQGPDGSFAYSPRSTAKAPGFLDAAGNPLLGREWEGIASTDFLSFEASIPPPDPEIAVGPDMILTVVNRHIVAYPNPNTLGSTAAVPVNYPFRSRSPLTQWIGETPLNAVCPTTPRTNVSCVIGNASVRYDQMQGRFVVLFTAVDTLARRASWVLIVSNWSTFTLGAPGTTEVFTTPQPPGPNQTNPNSGGPNNNWMIYYGSAGDGFGNVASFGNINSISDIIRQGSAPGYVLPQGLTAPVIDCAPGAVGNTTGAVCYFPTSARLGFTNDDIIIVSQVYNDNVPLANRSLALYDPAAPSGAPALGARVRVLKKAAFYRGLRSRTGLPLPLEAGASYAGSPAGSAPLQGDYYDIWSLTPPATGVPGIDTVLQYTVDAFLALPGEVVSQGLIYEPSHVRGRSLATFNGRANRGGAFATLVGSVSTAANQPAFIHDRLYVRTIQFTEQNPGSLPVPGPPTVDVPVIIGGIPSLREALQSFVVPDYQNPGANNGGTFAVAQRTRLAGGATPPIFVGDARPHRAISREGHIYAARVVDLGLNSTARFDGSVNYSTVAYDVIQKLSAAGAPASILNAAWQNGRYYAPMFDTPANVIQYGSVSPINLLPYLEKLFVGTTFPPLAQSDLRPTLGIWPYIGQTPALQQICREPQPGVGTPAERWAYPGLFDIRCGEDAFDTLQAFRNPISAVEESRVAYGIRGGAATDPTQLGLWLYGVYAKGRGAQISGPGQWGSYVAYYPLSFPARDPYNNSLQGYADVPRTHPFYTYIQIAKQTDIEPGSRLLTAPSNFNPDGQVLRRDMARWVIRSQMDDAARDAYLAATGGIFSSFADVATNDPDFRWIETMYRRGYTKGCQAPNDSVRRFCPNNPITRGEMAVFLVRAKMNSVFPTSTSGATGPTGCATGVALAFGDMFGLWSGCTPYFPDDVPANHPYFPYIQKLRELGITGGTGATTYSPDANITRGEMMVFLVRSFFP